MEPSPAAARELLGAAPRSRPSPRRDTEALPGPPSRAALGCPEAKSPVAEAEAEAVAGRGTTTVAEAEAEAVAGRGTRTGAGLADEVSFLRKRVAEQGFRMPAEWEAHTQCWMAWPERPDNWREQAKPAQEAFAEVASAISQFEPVTMLASREQVARARSLLPPSVSVMEASYNDSWMRDIGPTFVVSREKDKGQGVEEEEEEERMQMVSREKDKGEEGEEEEEEEERTQMMRQQGGACGSRSGREAAPSLDSSKREKGKQHAGKLLAVHWAFNAWGGAEGGCYSDWSLDSSVPIRVCELLGGVDRVSTSFVMEGGSFHVDGEGTLLTTEECLLNRNRNPQLSRGDIEARLGACLGVHCFIWLPFGLVGDDETNGHVDNIACFAKPGTVLLAWTDDPSHPQHRVCSQALKVLEQSIDARGRRLQVIKVPLPPALHQTEEEYLGLQGSTPGAAEEEEDEEAPSPREGVPEAGRNFRREGQLLAASYINFYLPNGGVVPAFGVQESDEAAKLVLEAAFPSRKVVMVSRGREIVLGGGNVHCITQQQPMV